MSSFGSSLINKSGKKIVPKAGGRRRPGAPSSLAAQDAASNSGRSSLEPSATPQPDPLDNQLAPPPGLPTPEVSQVATETDQGHEGIPRVRPTLQPRTEEVIPTIVSSNPAPRPIASSIPEIATSNSEITPASTSNTRRRSLSPSDQVSSSKRRRVDATSEPPRAVSPPVALLPNRPLDEDEIPIIQVSAKTPPRGPTRPSKASASKTAKQNGDLVQYEAPDIPAPQPSSSTPVRRAPSRPTIAPLLMATVTGPKPRAKGTRRNQWQITTPSELRAYHMRDIGIDVDHDENAMDGELAVPKLRKIRKDKGTKKGPVRRRENSEEECEDEDPASLVLASDQMDRALSAKTEREALTTAATQGRSIAPRPIPDGVNPVTRREREGSTESSGTPSGRLQNAQKRKAKLLARKNANFRDVGVQNATAIEDAISRGIEGRPLPNEATAFLKTQSRLHRGSSVTSGITDVTEQTEGGTVIKRKRYRRQATPPGSETVFIAEKVTPMMSLLNRDTEGRVGMRSTTEMRMRNLNWNQIKYDNDEEWKQAAIRKGGRRTNNFDLIMGRVDPANQSIPSTPASGGVEDDDESGDELERRIKAREKHFGPNAGIELEMVNGEHRIRAVGNHVRDSAEEIASQEGEFEAAEEEDLKKRRFNVHTFVKWKRRDPQERIHQSSRWNDEETEKFYEALRCCGVDFGSMVEWFPGRIRRSLKRKFNIEERANPDRVNEALDAHMMIVAHGSGNDDGTAWDMSQFHSNGAGRNLKDPREVEAELARIRAEREVEIEQARAEFEAEKQNKKLAGAESSSEEEDENGSEEVGSEEPEPDDIVGMMQKEMMEKKLREREGRATKTDEVDSGVSGEDDNDEDEVLSTVEQDEEEPADWSDEAE